MGIVQTQLAALTALVTPTAKTPTGDPGYGSDLDCGDDLTPLMLEVDGSSTVTVAQAVHRRLSTPRDGLVDDEDYGLDLRAYLSKAMTPQQQSAIAGQVQNEVRKDDRVEKVVARLANVTSKGFALVVQCEAAEGPFDLTIAVSDQGTLLSEMNA